jgi:SAM-dependent methyltransferase
MSNELQIEDWNGPLGQVWADQQVELDRITRVYGDAALAAAKAQTGERVVDVGCGCGDSSLTLGRSVGGEGAVLGVDVSEPMLAVAARRARDEGLAHVAFRHADASLVRLEPDRDLIFSRFGVMFFDDPQAAFANIRRWLKPTGRIAFCCWRPPSENPYFYVPIGAARAALAYDPPPMDPHAPGPFAFADVDRLRGLMTAAGFSGFNAERYDAEVQVGSNPEVAAETMTMFGPVARLIREVGEHSRPVAKAAVAKAFAPIARPDGSVWLGGSTWIVTARAA